MDQKTSDGRAARPLVSVVVPTYNRERLLAETMDAVLAQTYATLELIVVDNMSTDGTELYVTGHGDPRIRYVRSRRDANFNNIPVSRNVGIRAARGKYIAFCDNDDLWKPDKLAQQVALMEASPQVGLCYTDMHGVRDGQIAVRSLSRVRRSGNLFTRLLLRNFIGTSSVLVRKEVFDRIGMFDEAQQIAPFEDYEMWLRIAHAYPFACIDRPLVMYRLHEANWSSKFASKDRIVIQVLQSVRKKLGVHVPLLLASIWLRRARVLFGG